MKINERGNSAQSSEPSKRELIRDAAVKVFAAKGYHAATVDLVAETARVGKGTVYFYYASKEDLLLEILAFHFERMMEMIEAVEQLDVESAIQAVVADAMKRLRENPDLFKLMEQQPLLYHERVKVRFEDMFHQMVERMAGVLSAGIEEGAFRDFDPRAVASVLLSTAMSFPLYLSLYPDRDPVSVLDHLGEELSALLWAALKNPRSGH